MGNLIQIKTVRSPAPRVDIPSVLCGVRGGCPGRPVGGEHGRGDQMDYASASAIAGDDPASLRMLAEQCRRLARGASTATVSSSLKEIASNYEELAAVTEAKETPPPLPRVT